MRKQPIYRPSLETLESRLVLDASVNPEFVNALYGTLLGRQPDSAPAQMFASQLDQGQALRPQVVGAFLNSAEYETDLIDTLYSQLLHRAPDPSGLNNGRQFLAQGNSDLQLEAAILGSAEFFTNNGSNNATFLQAVYQDVLHRAADPSGLSSFLAQLQSGVSRQQVASTILTSLEGDQTLVESYYTRFLHRAADAGGLAGFTQMLASGAGDQSVETIILSSDEFVAGDPVQVSAKDNVALTAAQVSQLLQRAAAANANNGAIIAVVDRAGQILGVRVEAGVSPAITGNTNNLVFAIDGAVAEARTGAFFSNDQAPLTSRTIQFISQSTITQREVNSNPNIPDPNSTLRGPGLVAPIGLGGHFPAGIANTPSADLFEIEETNRDSIVNAGPDHVKGTGDDVLMPARFNIDPAFIPSGARMSPPESYGFVSGLLPNAQARGIGTLPGGIPLFENGVLVGGIGVFFPGTTGYASAENSVLSAGFNPALPDLSEEAEWMAFIAAGGSSGASFPAGAVGGIAPLPGFDLPFGSIYLAGITLDIYGPGGTSGPTNLVHFGQTLGTGNPNSGANQPLFPGDMVHVRDGLPAPDGWLVTPHASPLGTMSAAQVLQIINQGITQANLTRAQIRIPLNSHTGMVFAVADSAGNVLGMFRMPDATIFSEDVAVAKARNTAYYDDPALLQAIDQITGLPAGVAMTARTFRDLAQPRFPEGIDGTLPGPMSILNDGGTNPVNALNLGAPLPASAFQSALGFNSFNPNSNFHEPWSLNQNGVVFFPGSSAVYVSGGGTPTIVGGFGVSGDGVNQDDLVTSVGINSFQPPANLMADHFSVRGVPLPYAVFPRNPEL
jgi:uncharacterized protein GlcG (DUF336 family)